MSKNQIDVNELEMIAIDIEHSIVRLERNKQVGTIFYLKKALKHLLDSLDIIRKANEERIIKVDFVQAPKTYTKPEPIEAIFFDENAQDLCNKISKTIDEVIEAREKGWDVYIDGQKLNSDILDAYDRDEREASEQYRKEYGLDEE